MIMKQAIILSTLMICITAILVAGILTGQIELNDESIPEAEVVTEDPTFSDLLDAIEYVESKGKADAVGDGGDAIGAYQIHKIFVDDVNRILKLQGIDRRFFYQARLVKSSSRVMAAIYLNHYGGTFEEMARKHNGGPQGHKKESTKAYWLKVKARLEREDNE
jgi:hypothetical protein